MNNNYCEQYDNRLIFSLNNRADAFAVINGSNSYPDIYGVVRMYQTSYGVIVYTEVTGLPDSDSDRILGIHIHQGNTCSGNVNDPFADSLTHYNPGEAEHPYHAGDMPPLFSNNGTALSIFLTKRFTVYEIIGKVVIIHDKPDDFSTQPSGNSGSKIACGVLKNCHNNTTPII